MLRAIGIISGLVLAAGAALLLAGEERQVEARTISPAGYYMGAILVDGVPAQTGGVLVAEKWNGLQCGKGTLYISGGSAVYAMTVHSADTKPGCFQIGDPIIFKFNGMKAQNIPVFSNWGGQYVDLSFKTTRYFQCTPSLCPISSTPVLALPPQH